ncbi:hypothetical protein B0H14DRAFT_3536322 [Mycena olivaceomarginata]|nr:hypothetical protein B0H14DRAFT_3536322 [Mycena olivaceomarginata]
MSFAAVCLRVSEGTAGILLSTPFLILKVGDPAADDPHFAKYNASQQLDGEDEDDPYLRLDEEDGQAENIRNEQYPDMDEDEDGEGVGWLAHQRSPSPTYVPSPPLVPRTISPGPREYSNPVRSPPPTQSLSLALSESLLPRTGADAHAFHLPSPHSLSARGRSGRRKPQPNAHAAAAFLFAYTLLCVLSLLSLILHSQQSALHLLYWHTVPLGDVPDVPLRPVSVCTSRRSSVHSSDQFSSCLPWRRPSHYSSRPSSPLRGPSVPAPAGVYVSSLSSRLPSPSSASAASLQSCAAPPASPALLSLSARVLFFRAPLLLLLSPLLLLAGLILSLPLLTLLVRLPLSHSSVVAGGVGAWYFDYSVPAPPPAPSDHTSSFATAGGFDLQTGSPFVDAQLRVTHAALLRPLGPLVLAALFALLLAVLAALRVIHALGERLGGGRYTGVYCGLTGNGFWEGVGGVREVREKGAERAPPTLPLPRAYNACAAVCAQGVSYAEQQRAAICCGGPGGVRCAPPADTLYVCHLIDRAAGRRPEPAAEGSDADRQAVFAPLDDEAAAGLGLNFGGFDFGLGRFGFGLGGAGAGSGWRCGWRGAGTRRAGRGASQSQAQHPQQRGRDTVPPRGFRAPTREFSSVREYSPPPRSVLAASTVGREHVAQPQQQPPAPVEIESDVDSLDSRSDGGGESSGAFPGSGFF